MDAAGQHACSEQRAWQRYLPGQALGNRRRQSVYRKQPLRVHGSVLFQAGHDQPGRDLRSGHQQLVERTESQPGPLVHRERGDRWGRTAATATAASTTSATTASTASATTRLRRQPRHDRVLRRERPAGHASGGHRCRAGCPQRRYVRRRGFDTDARAAGALPHGGCVLELSVRRSDRHGRRPCRLSGPERDRRRDELQLVRPAVRSGRTLDDRRLHAVQRLRRR